MDKSIKYTNAQSPLFSNAVTVIDYSVIIMLSL